MPYLPFLFPLFWVCPDCGEVNELDTEWREIQVCEAEGCRGWYCFRCETENRETTAGDCAGCYNNCYGD